VARLALNAVAASRSGVDVSAAALTPIGANTGVQFVNNGQILLALNNGSGVSVTVTENVSPLVAKEGAIPAAAQMPIATIPAGKTYLIGTFHPLNYKQADGNTYLDINPIASVSVGLVQATPTLAQ
jgi:hypothetical protein